MANYPDVPTATAAIQAHPVCATFKAIPAAFVVYYPPTYTVPGGAMVKRGAPENDLVMLNQLYDLIDRFWSAQRLQVPAQ